MWLHQDVQHSFDKCSRKRKWRRKNRRAWISKIKETNELSARNMGKKIIKAHSCKNLENKVQWEVSENFQRWETTYIWRNKAAVSLALSVTALIVRRKRRNILTFWSKNGYNLKFYIQLKYCWSRGDWRRFHKCNILKIKLPWPFLRSCWQMY